MNEIKGAEGLYKRYKELIAEGKLEQVLNTLTNRSQSQPFEDDPFLLKSRLANLEKKWEQGIINSEDYDTQKTKLTKDLLGLINKISSGDGTNFNSNDYSKSPEKRNLKILISILILFFIFLISKWVIPASQLQTVTIDGVDYTALKHRGLVWMAEPLKIPSDNSLCDPDFSCDRDGRLYNFESAQTICPNGWQLPSDENWKSLLYDYGGFRDQLSNSQREVSNTLNKLNRAGFNFKVGSYAVDEGDFYPGVSGYWSGNSNDEKHGVVFLLSKDGFVRDKSIKTASFYCLCLKK